MAPPRLPYLPNAPTPPPLPWSHEDDDAADSGLRDLTMHFKMMNEYTVDWPFWNVSATTSEHPYLCAEEDPPLPYLPDELSQEIRRWARQFNEHFSWETGWPSRDMARSHEEQGRRLHEHVVAALPDDTVDFHYWETDDTDE